MQNLEKTTTRSNVLPWTVWGLGTLFYLYEFFVRVSPGIVQEELQETFKITAAEFGATMAIYYYIYSPMQLIVGALFDKFGGRKLLAPACILVGIGCCMFSIPTTHYSVLALGRLLMGFGSAFGFVGVMYLASVWFPQRKMSLLSGLTTAAGMLGAAIGEFPFAIMVDWIGWKHCFLAVGLLGCALGLLLYKCIPSEPASMTAHMHTQHYETATGSFILGLTTTLKRPYIWLLGLIAAAMYMPLAIFGDVWGVSYIISLTKSTRSSAAGAVSMLYLSWLIGGPLMGYYCSKLSSYKKPLFYSCLSSCLILGCMVYFQQLSLVAVYLFLFALGLASCTQVISFVACLSNCPSYARGSAIATINMIVMLMSGLFEWIIGFILDSKGRIYNVHHELVYQESSYQIAFMTLPVVLLIATVIAALIKEPIEDESMATI